jgi:hypothetical protein
MKKITLVNLLTDSKYKKMNITELTHVIDYELQYSDYCILAGKWSEGKAEMIKRYFSNQLNTFPLLP